MSTLNPQYIVYIFLAVIALGFTAIAVNNYYSETELKKVWINDGVDYYIDVQETINVNDSVNDAEWVDTDNDNRYEWEFINTKSSGEVQWNSYDERFETKNGINLYEDNQGQEFMGCITNIGNVYKYNFKTEEYSCENLTYERELIKYDRLYDLTYSEDGLKAFTKVGLDTVTLSENYQIREYILEEPFTIKGALWNDSIFIISDNSKFIYDGASFSIGEDIWICSLAWDISTCTHIKHFDAESTGNMLARALIAPTIFLASSESIDVTYTDSLTDVNIEYPIKFIVGLFAVLCFTISGFLILDLTGFFNPTPQDYKNAMLRGLKLSRHHGVGKILNEDPISFTDSVSLGSYKRTVSDTVSSR